MNGNLNESFSKIAKINNKSISTDANVLSKIKFGMKNEKNNNKENNYTNIKSPFHKKSDNYTKKIAIYIRIQTIPILTSFFVSLSMEEYIQQ